MRYAKYRLHEHCIKAFGQLLYELGLASASYLYERPRSSTCLFFLCHFNDGGAGQRIGLQAEILAEASLLPIVFQQVKQGKGYVGSIFG